MRVCCVLCRLIEKRRQPVTPVHFNNPYRWRQVSPHATADLWFLRSGQMDYIYIYIYYYAEAAITLYTNKLYTHTSRIKPN